MQTLESLKLRVEPAHFPGCAGPLSIGEQGSWSVYLNFPSQKALVCGSRGIWTFLLSCLVLFFSAFFLYCLAP